MALVHQTQAGLDHSEYAFLIELQLRVLRLASNTCQVQW